MLGRDMSYPLRTFAAQLFHFRGRKPACGARRAGNYLLFACAAGASIQVADVLGAWGGKLIELRLAGVKSDVVGA